MITIAIVLLIAALVVFLIAVFPVPSRINLVPLGLALLTASLLLTHVGALR